MGRNDLEEIKEDEEATIKHRHHHATATTTPPSIAATTMGAAGAAAAAAASAASQAATDGSYGGGGGGGFGDASSSSSNNNNNRGSRAIDTNKKNNNKTRNMIIVITLVIIIIVGAIIAVVYGITGGIKKDNNVNENNQDGDYGDGDCSSLQFRSDTLTLDMKEFFQQTLKAEKEAASASNSQPLPIPTDDDDRYYVLFLCLFDDESSNNNNSEDDTTICITIEYDHIKYYGDKNNNNVYHNYFSASKLISDITPSSIQLDDANARYVPTTASTTIFATLTPITLDVTSTDTTTNDPRPFLSVFNENDFDDNKNNDSTIQYEIRISSFPTSEYFLSDFRNVKYIQLTVFQTKPGSTSTPVVVDDEDGGVTGNVVQLQVIYSSITNATFVIPEISKGCHDYHDVMTWKIQ